MFTCFKCHHYNKLPLVCFVMSLYWKEKHPDLLKVMEEFFTIFNEYVGENMKAIIIHSTDLLDSVPVLTKKVKDIFAGKQSQATFRETFG